MINVSAAWMQSLYDDKRDYQVYIKITLKDNTVLNLSNENIWGGSLLLDDAVSNDNDLQLGAAIINKMSVTINNIYGTYDAYDFNGARVELKIGLIIDGAEEKINKGKYIVNNATYNGQLIALECYDYMYFFDVSYSDSGQTFPATIDNIVRNCCTDVGVPLNTYNFPHKNFTIEYIPDKTKTTYREIISWCAQICGCFARCNNNGQLEFKWYDFATLDQTSISFLNGGVFDENTPYSTGNTADGGRFNPWNLGDVYDSGGFNWNNSVHTISSVYRLNVSVDDVIITRIQAVVKLEDAENHSESEKAYNIGTEGYTVEIRSNPFITEDNVSEILSWLGTQLIGVKYRKANISHASNPSIEAGDCAVVFDRKNTVYPIIISRTSFSTGGSQNSISAAQNPLRNSAARFSAETKNYVDLRQRIQNERTTRQQIEAQLALDIANSNGMYKTETTEGGATKYYLHNKPQLSDSAIRILFSDVGITVTANGLDANPTWYGLRVNGDLISRILTATGVNADWIDTGALVVRDNKNNLVFKADISNHTVYVNGYATYTDLSGNGTTTINGANIKTGTISAARLELSDYAKFTDLSGNGTTTINGSNITTGTINANLIKAGTLQSQDSARYPNFSIDLSDGTITIKHGSINLGNNNFIVDDDGNVTIKKGSITIGTNENFKVTSNGSVTMKNATITGYLKPDDVGDNGITTISGNRIKTGTISAARLELTDYAKFTDLSGNGTTTINGDNIKTGTINADLIKAGTLKSQGYSPNFSLNLSTGELTMKNGSINLGNKFIVDENGNVTMKGTVTINGSSGSSGYVTDTSLSNSLSAYPTKTALKTSKATEINGDNISTGRIEAKYLDLTGRLTAEDLGTNGKTVISGSRISTGIIKSSNENVVFNLDNGSLKMNSGSININKNFIVDDKGNATFKGTVTISGSPTISGYVSESSLSNSLSGYATKEGLKNSGYTSIHGGNLVNFSISTYKIATEAITAEKIKTGTITANQIASKTITAGEISTGTITAKEIQSNISLAGAFKAVSSSSITSLEDGVLYTKDSNNSKYGRLQYTSLFAGSSTVALQTWYTSGTLYLSCGINGSKYISIDNGGIEMSGFSCNCSKSRIVKTEEYDTRALYCYETPSPMFGDLGEGTISDDGFCYVQIDPVFSRTVVLDDYKVFLQKHGEGDCYVFEKKSYCFIVKGTPNLIFDWEIKAKQFDCEQKRLDIYTVKINSPNNIVDYNIDGEDKINTEIRNTTYAEDAQEHIEELYKERTT